MKRNDNRTAVQKWRDRYHGKRCYGRCDWCDPVPKYYRQMFNRERKARAKVIFQKILNGYEMEFELEKKDVRWWWW